ncbi:MAG: YbaN family protein [Bacteroidales bacterium]|nr:YbaN family protein [Bacteroidales bacterium]
MKYVLATLGLISLFLGIIGVFLPLLPTTPFLLLSAALFMKSSTRLYNWLMNHKYLGKHLKNYLLHKTISKKSKISALSLLWLAILATIIIIIDKLIIKILLLVIAIAVTIHILSFKSITKE